MLKTKSNITIKNPSGSKLLVCRHKTLGLLFKPTHLTPTIEKKDVHPLGIDICTISDNLLPFQSKGNAVSILPKREEAKKMS